MVSINQAIRKPPNIQFFKAQMTCSKGVDFGGFQPFQIYHKNEVIRMIMIESDCLFMMQQTTPWLGEGSDFFDVTSKAPQRMVPTHAWLNEVEWYGWTADGQLFDAALNRGEPAVEVQQSTVPKGFWEGADKPNWSIQGRFVPQVSDWISVSKVYRSDVFFYFIYLIAYIQPCFCWLWVSK